MHMPSTLKPTERQSYNVGRMVTHHCELVNRGKKCARCWFEPRNCMCLKAKEWLPTQTPTGRRSRIQVLMLFHAHELGALSNTGKLVIAGGVGKGYIHQWTHFLHDAPTSFTEQSAMIGLEGDIEFATVLENAAKVGPVAVLYPIEGAVDAATFWSEHLQRTSSANGNGNAMQSTQQRVKPSNSERIAILTTNMSQVTSQLGQLRTRSNHLRMKLNEMEEETKSQNVLVETSPTTQLEYDSSENVSHRDQPEMVTATAITTSTATPITCTSNGADIAETQPQEEIFTVVVLDGTYNQARQLNRISILSNFPRVKITATVASDFNPLRAQSKHREETGRTSTVEAVAALLQTVEPTTWDTPHVRERWQHTLRFMVDNVRCQRGLPSCYDLDDAIARNRTSIAMSSS